MTLLVTMPALQLHNVVAVTVTRQLLYTGDFRYSQWLILWTGRLLCSNRWFMPLLRCYSTPAIAARMPSRDANHARVQYYWMTVFGATGKDTTPRVAVVGRGIDDLVRVNGK